MSVRSSRHQQLLEELAEWWEDIRDAGIGSRVVLVEVPRAWGATTVLREFHGMAGDPDAPITIPVGVNNVPLVNRAVQAEALRDTLMASLSRSRLAHLL